MKKRIVSWLLVLVMVFGMIPMPTHAADAADYSAYVHRKAQFNPVYESATFPITAAPDNVEWSTATQLQGAAIPDDLVVVIDAYYADTTKNALWFKVSAAEGYTLPEALSAEPWVFQDAISYSMGASLVFLPCEICGQADCVSKHENWCDICRKDDCGEDHSKPTDPSEPEVDNCDKCDDPECDGEHPNWCDICHKDNCGEDHSKPTDPSGPEDLPLVDEVTGITVSGEGIPEGAEVVVGVPIVDVGPGAGIFDIKMMVDGEEWQPIQDGQTVTVSIPVNTDAQYVDVYHFIDYAPAINGNVEYWPIAGADAETMALLAGAIAASDKEGYVAVERILKTPVAGGFVAFNANSFSVYVLNGNTFNPSEDDTSVEFENGLFGSNDENTVVGDPYYATPDTVFTFETSTGVTGRAEYGTFFTVKEGSGYVTLDNERNGDWHLLGYKKQVTVSINANTPAGTSLKVLFKTNRKAILREIIIVRPVEIKFNANLPAGITPGNMPEGRTDPNHFITDANMARYTLPTQIPTATNPSDPEDTYEFLGWNTSPAGDGEFYEWNGTAFDKTYLVPSQNMTLYAMWERHECKVTLDHNDGTGNEQSWTMPYGSEFTKLEQPERPGYVFLGWSASEDGSGVRYKLGTEYEKLTVKSDVTLYAIWGVELTINAIGGTISVQRNGETGFTKIETNNKYGFQVTSTTSNGVTTNKYYVVAAEKSYAGAYFRFHPTSSNATIGGDASGSAMTFLKMPNDATKLNGDVLIGGSGLTAVTTITFNATRNYIVSFNADGGSAVDSVMLSEDDNTINLNNYTTTKEGNEFAGWYDPDGNKVEGTYTVNKDITFTARWTLKKFDVILSADNGIASVSGSGQKDYSSSVVVVATTKPGYQFVNWTENDNAVSEALSYTFLMPSRDIVLAANTELINYQITYDVDGISPVSYNIESKDALPTLTRDGYEFKGWKVAEASGNWTKDDVVQGGTPLTGKYGDVKLTAQWEPIRYAITYDVDGMSPVSYNIESEDTLPTLQRDGYEFKGWKVAEASGNWTEDDVVQGGTPLTGKYGDVKLTAQWEPIRYTITYHLDGAENPGNPTFYTVETKDFTLISPQKAGYRFDGWTSNVGATFDYGLPKVDVSQANRSELVLTAKWVKTFNVTLHYNYTGCTDAVEVKDKDSTFVLPSPERDTHNFLGWYTAATGGEKVESPITVNDDVELYAQWMHKKLDAPIVVGINMMYHNPNGDYQDGISESAYHRFPNDPREHVTNNGIRVYLLDGKWTLTKNYELTLPHKAGYYISEDIISMIANGEIGVRDDDGSTIYDLLGDRLDFDGIVDAWKTNGEQFCKTFNFENDIQWDKVKNAKFNVIPYVIKFHSGKWFVDLVILPEYQRTLSYKLNLDPNYSGASVPADRWYTGGFTATVVAPSGSPSYTVDGLTYTAQFDYWMGSDGKQYSPDTQVTMNADLTLTAQWTYPAKYAVKHYLENADDDGYTLAETVYATGLIGADTQAKAKTYNGFTAKAFSQTKIVEDGSAEVAIYYSRDTYKVSYKVNAQTPAGITVPAEKIYKWGATVEVAENLTSAYYNFSAWETTGVSQIQNGSFTMPKNPVEFVSECTYTVQFHSNFGTEVTKNETHTYGASKALGNNTFTRDGYQFIGWSAEPNAVDATYADGESVTNLSTDTNAVAHLYAVWKRITHTVTYNGGAYDDYVNQEFTVNYGTEITIPEAAWDDNHKLEYWLGANGSTYRPGDKVTVQDDLTFTAIWLTRYTVVHHYKRLDNTWSEYSSTNNWGTAGEMTDAQAYGEDTGFKVNEIQNVELSLKGDTVVHIYYDRLSYTLRYEVTCENGPVPSTATQTYEVTVPYYTEVNIISEADQPGYTFSGWTVVEDDVIPNENGTFRMPAHAVTIKGTWTQLRYDISYRFDNHPNQAAAPDRITDRVYGDKYTLPEVRVPEGWRFLGWKEAGSESETYLQPGTELSVTDSKTYVGYFEEIYCTLTYIADLEGSEVPATQKVKYGTEVTIQNIVKIPEGYTFEHWQVMDSEETYEPDAVVELKADLTLYPKWTPNVYNILFYMQKGNGVPEAVGTVTGYPETYAENVQIGPWPEVTGYQFEKWELRKALTDTIYAQSSESVFSFKMPAHNLVAIVKLTPKNDAGYTVIFREKLGDNSYKEIKREEASNLTYDRQFTISTAIPGFSTIDPALTEVTVTAGYNTIVYVDYTRNSYNLYYAGNGVGDRTEQVPYGKEVQPGIPTLEGHSFIGWLMDANLNGQKDEGETILGENLTFTMPASDLRLIAQWNVVEYAIEYVFVPNDMAELDGKTTKYGLLVEFPVSEVTVPTGYELSWSAKTKAGTQITDDGKKFTMPAADVVVTGTFTPIEYTINFDSNQGDPVEAQTYTIATDIALPTPTRTNYDFVGWQILSADAESNWSQTGNLLGTIPKGQYGNVTLKAQWKLQTKKMTVSVNGVDSDHNSIFRIYGSTLDGETVDLQIIINGNGSKVITGIPVGNYTVTEISGWTWRYIGDMSKTAELVNGNYVANFSFGAVGNPYWINDYSYGVFWRGGGQ